jgi:hypothetical protein
MWHMAHIRFVNQLGFPLALLHIVERPNLKHNITKPLHDGFFLKKEDAIKMIKSFAYACWNVHNTQPECSHKQGLLE